MTQFRAFGYSLSALALSAAGPALADVTAGEIWAEWQTQSEQMSGQVITADEVIEGDGALTLRGLSSSYSDEDVSIVGRFEEVVLTENGDGTVSVDVSEIYAQTMTIDISEASPPAVIEFDMVMPDMAITVSGEASTRLYDYAGSSISLENVRLSGGDGPPPEVVADMIMRDFAAQYEISDVDSDNPSMDSTISLSSMNGVFDISPPPGEPGHLKMSMSMGAMTSTGQGTLGNYYRALLAGNSEPIEGLDLNGEATYDRFSLEVDFQDGMNSFTAFYENAGGGFDVTMSDEMMAYDINTTGAQVRASSSEAPFPFEMSMESSQIAFQVPLGASEDPADFGARIAYQGVDLGSEIWNMMDATQSFPRDPLTLIADISGTAVLFVDLLTMDPEAMTAPPGELRSLTVNEVRVNAGGAELSGSGDLTFAPGQVVPMPVGAINLELSGGNALLDRLQETGIIPIEQLAMARGMLGAFARPGAAPDTMETTVEFTEGGGITANGVPLQ